MFPREPMTCLTMAGLSLLTVSMWWRNLMPSFQRASFSLIEVQMNWPTFLLGSQGAPLGGGDQLRSRVGGKFSGVAANQSGGVAAIFLIIARTSALVFGFVAEGAAGLLCAEATPRASMRNRIAALCFMRSSGIRPWPASVRP